MAAPSALKAFALATGGLVLWGAWFNAIYAVHGAGCAFRFHEVDTPAGSLQRVVLVAVWIAGIAAAGAWLAWVRARPARDETTGFVRRLAIASAWVGLAATAAIGVPAVATTSCGETPSVTTAATHAPASGPSRP